MTRGWPAPDADAPMHGLFAALLFAATLVLAGVVMWLLYGA